MPNFALITAFVAALTLLISNVLPGQAQPNPGLAIYEQKCASCHGKNGEGVAGKYDEPLYGERTVAALARKIERTMPEDKVGECVGDEAVQVSQYIYDAFYSPAARARNHPPAFDLSRLTVAQYQNAVADIMVKFRPGSDFAPNEERGLKAHYRGFAKDTQDIEAATQEEKDKKRQKNQYKFERTDPQIAFQWKGDSPEPEKMRGDEFEINWEGSLIAEETGSYEFVIKSENGARLFLNDRKDPVIDGWVTSGDTVREEKGSIFLLGGRAYPIRVEFHKYKDKSASIELLWKAPHGVQEVVPQRVFHPQNRAEALIVSTPFPADDRSAGYERGSSVSKEWDQATTAAAIEVANYIETNLENLVRSKADSPDRPEKLKQFAGEFVERAFRRPLTDEQRKLYIDNQFAEAKRPEVAVKRVVLLTLKSPRFLYPHLQVGDKADDFDVATRLSFALWDSLPSEHLLRQAAGGHLKKREQIAQEAQRMMSDPRTKAKLHGFFYHWLELERAENVAKDAKLFPAFNEQVLADLKTSLRLFIDGIVWSDKSDYRELLLADYLPLNERLAKLYGKEKSGDKFEKVIFNANERVGVVTHPYLLTAFAYNKDTSPIHRGVFLTRNLIGLPLKPPPDAVKFEDAHFNAKLTMREKVTELTQNKSCMSCHAVINPLGFGLENYDAIGRWRTQDNNKPVDPSSDFTMEDGQNIRLNGAKDIANLAAESESGQRAFIHHLFHHAVKQPNAAYGPDTIAKLHKSFVDSGFHMQKLLTEIAITTATHGLETTAISAK